MQREREIRVTFKGRKINSPTPDFYYTITQVVYGSDLGDAIIALEEKYKVKEVIN